MQVAFTAGQAGWLVICATPSYAHCTAIGLRIRHARIGRVGDDVSRRFCRASACARTFPRVHLPAVTRAASHGGAHSAFIAARQNAACGRWLTAA